MKKKMKNTPKEKFVALYVYIMEASWDILLSGILKFCLRHKTKAWRERTCNLIKINSKLNTTQFVGLHWFAVYLLRNKYANLLESWLSLPKYPPPPLPKKRGVYFLKIFWKKKKFKNHKFYFGTNQTSLWLS